jgi:hypothetical protein
MSLGATLDLEIHQMDVKCAFLNGDLDENIYMSQLKGNKVVELKFCLQITQAHIWVQTSTKCLEHEDDGFLKSCSFKGVSQIKSYIMQRKESMSVSLTLYVDNLLIINMEL